MKVVSNANGYKPVCVGLYECDNSGKYENSIIDKMIFDSDRADLFVCTKLHVWAKEHNYKHIMVFSGNGTHFYLVVANGGSLINNKRALNNAQRAICKELGLSIGDKKTDDVDVHLVGNVAGLGRLPNTYNTKRRRYCIPIAEKDLEQGYDFIREKAKKQSPSFAYYGREGFDIKPYDTEPKESDVERVILDADVKTEINMDILLKTMPLCISSALQKGECGYRKRFLVISYLREEGYMLSETIQILKRFLTENKFKHCIFQEQQPMKLYNRPELYFPSCEKIASEGLCVQGCKQKGKVYL